MTLLGVVFMRTARTLARWQGGVLLGCYVPFMTVVALRPG